MTAQPNLQNLVITGISTKFPHRFLPQYADNKSPYALSTTEQNLSFNQSSGCSFDPHCPECIRELWGPLLSPFAYLIKQNAQYFNEILSRMGHPRVNTTSKSTSKSTSNHLPKPPKLEYEDHKFLGGSGLCAFHSAKIVWLITWTFGFLLLILTIVNIFLNDSLLPPIIVILRMNTISLLSIRITFQIICIIISLIGIGKMFASILGLFGASNRSENLMLGALLFIAILILFEVAVTILCFVRRSEITTSVELALGNSFGNHYGNGNNSNRITSIWDQIFQNYKCCGWLGNDFNRTSWSPSPPNNIPYSCCRPGALHPGCESTNASAGQNYANQGCRNVIRTKVFSNTSMAIAYAIVGVIIFVEIMSAILTFVYSSTLKTARQRRRRQNEKSMDKYRTQLESYTQEPTDHISSDQNHSIAPGADQVEIDDLRQLYNQYTAFHQTPPGIDPSLMSITPTVIQVKRPNVYSYFYYE